jgi:NTP pyrophosphatase (non-canonical NTP hydrolase)
MPTLPERPTLANLQEYIRVMVHERGFQDETIEQLFMLLMEECGELAKAARKHVPVKSDPGSDKYHIDHEAADVLMYLLAICNKFDIDLEQAFRAKEEINNKRTWH